MLCENITIVIIVITCNVIVIVMHYTWFIIVIIFIKCCAYYALCNSIFKTSQNLSSKIVDGIEIVFKIVIV